MWAIMKGGKVPEGGAGEGSGLLLTAHAAIMPGT